MEVDFPLPRRAASTKRSRFGGGRCSDSDVINDDVDTVDVPDVDVVVDANDAVDDVVTDVVIVADEGERGS